MRKNRFSIWYQLPSMLLAILLPYMLWSQQPAGKLTGKIKDGSNNEPLTGTSITAKGTKYGTTSITDGSYILALPTGTYTIAISSTGYQTKEITGVLIKQGQPFYLDILLEASKKEMEGVVVTASIKKEAQSALYSAQKRSAAASDGISLEAIRKTPDNNAGQILKRVVGLNVQDNRFVVVRGLNDQYNQTMLNGVPMTSTESNRNAFAFDLIPAAVIDNITVNKTATPDMPGNFAGGIVQINTKDFPANDFVSITLQGGFSDRTIGKDFLSGKLNSTSALGFKDKSLNLPTDFPTGTSKVPIYYLNAQERTRFLKQLNNNLAPINHGPTGLNENFQFGFGKTLKLTNTSQLGIVVAITQRKTQLIEEETTARDPVFSQNLMPDTISGIGYYSQNKRYRYTSDLGGVVSLAFRFGNNKISIKSLYSQVLNNLYIDRSVVRFTSDDFFNLPTPYIGLTHFTENKTLYNSILSGEHRTGKNNEVRLDWNVNVTTNTTSTPDTRNFIFGIEDSAKRIVSVGSNNLDYKTSLTGSSRSWSFNKDLILGGAFNITTPVTIFKRKQLFKTGILFQDRKRSATGTVLPIEGTISTTIDQVLSPDNYAPGLTDVTSRLAFQASTSSNYTAGSGLIAIYESLENRIGKKIRIIWGLRMENYQQNISVYTPKFFRDFEDPIEQQVQFGARTTFNFLPSINLIYSLSPSINIRGAYSSTVIRPELKDLASFARYDYLNFSLTQGNQFLKSASIRNFDVKLEWFPSSGEILSISAFHKQLTNPIEYAKGKTGPDGYDRIRIPVNAGDATVNGFEAEIRKKLDFINFLPWLRNITLFGNGTVLQSSVKRKDINNEYFSYVGEHPLTGQAPYIVNAGISVQLIKNSLETTLSLNKTGDYNNELGSSDFTRRLPNGKLTATVPPYRVKGRNSLDFVLTQSLFREKMKFKLNISNLLNEPIILYQDINGNGKFDDPVYINVFKSEDNYLGGTDNTASKIIPQRTYSLAVTYTF